MSPPNPVPRRHSNLMAGDEVQTCGRNFGRNDARLQAVEATPKPHNDSRHNQKIHPVDAT